MSEIIISTVKTSKELKSFVRFNYELYKGCPYAVPDLLEDTMDTFNPKKNPAFNFCEAACFLAKRDRKIVGRIAAIINKILQITGDNRFHPNKSPHTYHGNRSTGLHTDNEPTKA